MQSCIFSLLVWFVSCACAVAATVNHTFVVGYFSANPDGYKTTWFMGINGGVVGPEVRVRRGDNLIVTVINACPTEEVTIHWHGFEMRNAQEYDGALGITMCSIKPMQSFIYNFVVDEAPGTYQYHEHAHLEHVATRALFGPLIVEEPSGTPQIWNYDQEAVLTLSDYSTHSTHGDELNRIGRLVRPASISAVGNFVGALDFHNILINGRGGFNVFGTSPSLNISGLEELTPKVGETWRLRLINAGIFWAMRFRIDGHRLRVIQSDAADVQEYPCDAVTLSSGERFDILVTFDQDPGSYWFRVETLEGLFGVHHGQLGVLRYEGSPQGVEPDKGYHRRQRISESPGLVTLNCIDQENTVSQTCRPITDLKRHPSFHDAHVGQAQDVRHDFEMNVRGFNPAAFPGHFIRLLDLQKAPNTYGDDQFDGEYVQFVPPTVPYSWVNGSSQGVGSNTLEMRVSLGETVRVIIQLQDRVAHPFHLHGHKFAVLGIGFPNYEKDCDIVYCRSQTNYWVSRDGYHHLLDPAVAPLKDTVHLPAGGWVVLQFKADNPGWWLFHCHMATHAHDGMAVVLVEGADAVPTRLKDPSYFAGKGFPSCAHALQKLDTEKDSSCNCWANPEDKMDTWPRDTYKCSHWYLCGQYLGLNPLDPPEPERRGARNRAAGRPWRVAMFAIETIIVVILFAMKSRIVSRIHSKARASLGEIQTLRNDLAACSRQSTTPDRIQHGSRLARSQTGLFNWANPKEYQLSLAFEAHVVSGNARSPSVSGEMHPGSLVLLMGRAPIVEPWLNFFALRKEVGAMARVVGNIKLGGRHVAEWHTDDLRQAQCYIPSRYIPRPKIYVQELLDMYANVAPRIGKNMLSFRDHLIELFELESYLDCQLEKLEKHIHIRVEAAVQLLLPRSVVIVQDPMGGGKLDKYTAEWFVHRLRTVASQLKVTVIFSGCSSLTGSIGKHVTHVLLLAERGQPVFGSVMRDLRAFCAYIGEPVPDSSNTPEAVLEYCSELIMKGRLSDSVDVNGHWKAAAIAPSSWQLAKHFKLPRRSKQDGGGVATSFRKLLDKPRRSGLYRKQTAVAQAVPMLRIEFKRSLHDNMTKYKLAETIGIGVVTGCVWFQKGSQDTLTPLGESIGLLFFTTALWTVPPVFQAMAMTANIVERTSHEYLSGVSGIKPSIIAMYGSWLCSVCVWPPFWQIIAYTFADIGPSAGSMLLMHLILVLNVLSMRTLGLFLALLVPNSALNVVIGNLAAQLFMLTNGFYTKVPPWFQPVTYLSVPRYTLKALLKLEFSWRDTFEVNPMSGNAGAGYPTQYIFAEQTGTFELMAERQMGIMKSPEDANLWVDFVVLAGTTVTFACLFGVFLRRAIKSAINVEPHITEEGYFHYAQPWLEAAIPDVAQDLLDRVPASDESDAPASEQGVFDI